MATPPALVLALLEAAPDRRCAGLMAAACLDRGVDPQVVADTWIRWEARHANARARGLEP